MGGQVRGPDAAGSFLFVTCSGGGNVQPAIGLMRLLAARGHRVRALADPALRARVEAAGGAFRACPPLVWDASQGRAIEDNLDAFARLLHSSAVADAALVEMRGEPTDVAVVDCLLMNALCAAEAARLPAAVLVHVRYGYPLDSTTPAGRAGALARLNDVRTHLGLTPLPPVPDDPPRHRMWARFDRALVTVPRELENPAVALAPNVRHVGPIFEEADGALTWDPPWPPERDEPLVVVSFGTTYMHQEEMTERVLAALEGLSVRVLLTLGPALSTEELRIPSSVVTRTYVPHLAVLPQAALVVTHAGMGTVNAALACGVPMVCLPLGRDQHINAQRVAALGAGITLGRDAAAEEIRAAVVEALRSKVLRDGARRMAEIGRSYGRGSRAINELEALLARSPWSHPTVEGSASRIT